MADLTDIQPGSREFERAMVLSTRDVNAAVEGAGMKDLSLLAAAAGMGATFVRVGYEDSIYLAPGRVAKSNVELVERTVVLIEAMGLAVATPAEARRMLGLLT